MEESLGLISIFSTSVLLFLMLSPNMENCLDFPPCPFLGGPRVSSIRPRFHSRILSLRRTPHLRVILTACPTPPLLGESVNSWKEDAELTSEIFFLT